MAKRVSTQSTKAEKPNLEDYEPGATKEEFLSGLRKAVQPTKKPSESPDSASSKT